MSIGEFERRLVDLERTVDELKARIGEGGEAAEPWWRKDAGRFRDDPVFDEIVRLGAAYRKSLGPEGGRTTLIVLDTDVLTIVQRAASPDTIG